MRIWADYVIMATIYNDDHSQITAVRRRRDTGKVLVDEVQVEKQEIINDISAGYTYVTAYRNKHGKWRKGDRVRVVRMDKAYFIRTDGNYTKADNLGELPEYSEEANTPDNSDDLPPCYK